MNGLRKLALPPRERLRNLQNTDMRGVRGGVPPALLQQGVNRHGGPLLPNDLHIAETNGCMLSHNANECSSNAAMAPTG